MTTTISRYLDLPKDMHLSIISFLDTASIKSLCETCEKMQTLIKNYSQLSIIYQLNEKYPKHIFIQLLYHADRHSKEEIPSQLLCNALKAEKSIPEDIVQACEWASENITSELEANKDWHQTNTIILSVDNLVQGILLKKKYEEKYPGNKITFNPNCQMSDTFQATRRWLLIDGVDLRDYEDALEDGTQDLTKS